MKKLILVNIGLFIGCLVIFFGLVFGISYAMGADKHEVEVELAYIAVACMHLAINATLLRKWQLATPKNKLVSSLLIAAAYILYLFIF